MSSLIFDTDSQQVLVVTDTLAVDVELSPMFCTSKAHYLPHIRTIVAGTGAGSMADKWYAAINSRPVKGVEDLNHVATDLLQEIWDELKGTFPEGQTSTIYHFGLSERTDRICVYAYRSTSGFISEELPYGVHVKPECNAPSSLMSDLGCIRKVMEEQRQRHADLGIGGQAIAMHLNADGCSIFKLFDFSGSNPC